MELKIKISLHAADGTRFFGYGIYMLLLGIRESGSLRSAAAEMGMAYSKAFRIFKTAEEHFGFPLTRRKNGGAGGGGSELTPRAEELVERYRLLLEERDELAAKMYDKYFADYEKMGPET